MGNFPKEKEIIKYILNTPTLSGQIWLPRTQHYVGTFYVLHQFYPSGYIQIHTSVSKEKWTSINKKSQSNEKNHIQFLNK